MTLTEQMKADGWIEHDGGPCPVPLGSKPAIMFRDGQTYDQPTAFAAAWHWSQLNQLSSMGDIIAYKPEQPQ
jgi:hypothetical protein